MTIIHIIYSADKFQLGIWNAALSTAKILSCEYGWKVEVWYGKSIYQLYPYDGVESIQLETPYLNTLVGLMEKRGLDPKEHLIITHGCWKFPTIWGNYLRRKGFKWIFVPHGMLNSWGIMQKWWLKVPYLWGVESQLMKKADGIRAVGFAESREIRKWFLKRLSITFIPLGVPTPEPNWQKKPSNKRIVLFMARLHPGKGLIPLINAWLRSTLHNHPEYQLIVAGPDQGELAKMQAILEPSNCKNIEYAGPVYGEEKLALMNQASFFIGPSESETFPTTIAETMAYGCVPVVTPESNFPEIFELNLGIKISQKEAGILKGLEQLKAIGTADLLELQRKTAAYITKKFTLARIAELEHYYFKEILMGSFFPKNETLFPKNRQNIPKTENEV